MQDERLNQILCHYGIGAQTMKTIEELSELIQALVKKDKDNNQRGNCRLFYYVESDVSCLRFR